MSYTETIGSSLGAAPILSPWDISRRVGIRPRHTEMLDTGLQFQIQSFTTDSQTLGFQLSGKGHSCKRGGWGTGKGDGFGVWLILIPNAKTPV